AAVPGARRIRVATGGGTIDSAVNLFIVRAAPAIVSLSQNAQSRTLTFVIRGSNIRDPVLVPPNPAVGTTVRFDDPLNPANNTVSPTVLVQPDAVGGDHRILVTVPSPA